jgi:hypothetical protein
VRWHAIGTLASAEFVENQLPTRRCSLRRGASLGRAVATEESVGSMGMEHFRLAARPERQSAAFTEKLARGDGLL